MGVPHGAYDQGAQQETHLVSETGTWGATAEVTSQLGHFILPTRPDQAFCGITKS